jgi:hypothetical protein
MLLTYNIVKGVAAEDPAFRPVAQCEGQGGGDLVRRFHGTNQLYRFPSRPPHVVV